MSNLDRIVLDILALYRSGAPTKTRLNFLILDLAPERDLNTVRDQVWERLGVFYPQR